MAEFGLIRSFDIDGGELDECDKQTCFVLGYELARIDALLEAGSVRTIPFHADNYERIKKACEDAGATYSIRWLEGDVSESWMELTIA